MLFLLSLNDGDSVGNIDLGIVMLILREDVAADLFVVFFDLHLEVWLYCFSGGDHFLVDEEYGDG